MVQLKKIQSPNFRYSKKLLISEHYAVSLTGRRAVIMDQQFNVLHEIDHLDYVYKGEISASEKWLLLVSNGNLFYLYSLEPFQFVKKQRMIGVYNFNLEGLGCFSFDEKSILIPMMNKQTFTTVLRMYELDNFSKYRDYPLNNQYQVNFIQPIPDNSEYLMEAYDRVNDKNALIWFDGENYSAYTVYGEPDYVHVDYDKQHDRVTLFGMLSTRIVNREGRLIQVLSDGNSDSFFRGMDRDMSRPMNDSLNGIMAICKSSYYSFCYVGTGEGLIIYNPSSDEILFKKKILYGVQEIQELRSNLISVVTFDQNMLYQVIVERE